MMYSLFIFIAVNTVSLVFVDQVISGLSVEGGTVGYLLVGLVIGFLNLVLKPVLKIVALPLIFLTGGLFVLIINAAILYLTREIFVFVGIAGVGLALTGWLTYVFASVLFGFCNFVLHKILG